MLRGDYYAKYFLFVMSPFFFFAEKIVFSFIFSWRTRISLLCELWEEKYKVVTKEEKWRVCDKFTKIEAVEKNFHEEKMKKRNFRKNIGKIVSRERAHTYIYKRVCLYEEEK